MIELTQLVLRALREPATVVSLPARQLDLSLRLLRRLRLLGPIAVTLKDQGLIEQQPAVVADQLLSALTIGESRKRAALWELNRLAWALGELPAVPLVALKGCAYVLSGTPNARGRSFADVDLLVPETSLPAVEAQLRRSGWIGKEVTPYDDQYYRRWTHEVPAMVHAERDVEVDLHHNILMRTARLRPDANLLLAAARAVPGSRFKVLAPIDMVLHAMGHLFFGSEMDDALRDLYDIDQLLQHFSATEPAFWDHFWVRAEALDLARAAYYGLRYSRLLLGTPMPQQIVDNSAPGSPAAPVRALMDYLVPRALFAQHPDLPLRRIKLARLLLYIRSHWVKMPPFMLLRHLGHKFFIRNIRSRLPYANVMGRRSQP